MPQSLVLICPDSVCLSSLELKMKGRFEVKNVKIGEGYQELQINSDDLSTRLSIGEIVDRLEAVDDYKENDLLSSEFREGIDETYRCFLIGFNDLLAIKGLVLFLVRHFEDIFKMGWIDTEYGYVLSAAKFCSNMSEDSDWDWRSKPGAA